MIQDQDLSGKYKGCQLEEINAAGMLKNNFEPQTYRSVLDRNIQVLYFIQIKQKRIGCG